MRKIRFQLIQHSPIDRPPAVFKYTYLLTYLLKGPACKGKAGRERKEKGGKGKGRGGERLGKMREQKGGDEGEHPRFAFALNAETCKQHSTL